MLYDIVKKFSYENLPENISKKELELYFEPDFKNIDNLQNVYIRLIGSAQNYQYMPNTIKFGERYEMFKDILFDFDYNSIAKLKVEDLYDIFCNSFGIVKKDSKKNSWYRYTRAVIDSAKFISYFNDINDFKQFIEAFSYNSETKIALPLLISSRIHGIGFALACDFLKEIGYVDYPKPDVHIKDICRAYGLEDADDDILATRFLIEEAHKANITPYKLDKMIWLICSGNYYFHDIKVSSKKKELIETITKELENK